MMLLEIHDVAYLSKLVHYLDHTKIIYTTNKKEEYNSIFIAETSSSIYDLVKQNKRIIFDTRLEEEKILNSFIKNNQHSRNYLERLSHILEHTDKIIVRHIGIQKLLENKFKSNYIIIPNELPPINIGKTNQELYQRYGISKRKKKILIIDFSYHYIRWIALLSKQYPKYNFLYLGYLPDSKLNENNLKTLKSLNKNVTLIKYHHFDIYSDLCRISNLIISFEPCINHYQYLDLIFFFEKNLLLKNESFYKEYLIDNENVYLFESAKEFYPKVKNILEGKINKITEKTFELVKDNCFEEIVKKYSMYLS